MTKTINIYEAKTQLSALVERAAAGEEIVIAKAGKPRARLIALPAKSSTRVPGRWKGKTWISDDFDEPLPKDIQAVFEGREI